MKNYEGPVFNKKKKADSPKRKFVESSQLASGKFTFEPAYKKSQDNTGPNSRENIAAGEGMSLKDQTGKRNEMTEPALPLKNYEIPFLKRQEADHPVTQFKDKLQIPTSSEDTDKLRSPNRKRQTEAGDRSQYQPSLTRKQKSETGDFRVTQLPKPYKITRDTQSHLSEREVALRLRKSKDSFLLFEK